MGSLLRMLGLAWTLLAGYYILHTLPSYAPPMNMILSMLMFCFPGLVLLGIGELLYRSKKDAGQTENN